MARAPRVRRIWPISLTVSEAAIAAGMSLNDMRSHVAAGRIPAYISKFRRRLVLVEDVVIFIKKHLEKVVPLRHGTGKVVPK